MLGAKSWVVVLLGAITLSGCGDQQGSERTDKPAESSGGGSTVVTAGPLQGATVAPVNHPALSVVEDSSGRSNIKFSHFNVGNRNVKSILADGSVIWVGTSGGVIKYDTKLDDYKRYDVRSGLLSNGIFHLSKWRGKLMVGTYGGGLSIFDIEKEEWANYNIQHGLADAFIYDLLTLDNGDIWIATWSGANRIVGGDLDDLSKWETYTVENTQGGLPNDWVYGLDKGKNGEIWMATEGGLARYMDGKWSNWKHDDGLGAPYELVKDDIKFKRDPSKESSHHAQQKIEMGLTGVDIAYNPNYIVALHVDEAGNVWTGTWGAGLSMFDGTSWKTLTTVDGLPANHIFMLGGETRGGLWIGTSEGLVRYEGKSFTTFTQHDGLYVNNVFSMTNGDDGSLWIGGFGGVTRLLGMDMVKQ